MSQLTAEQRYTIEVLLKKGESQTTIAELIGCHKSTISREIKRNTGSRGTNAKVYIAKTAQHKTESRHRFKTKKQRFTSEMKDYIVLRLMVEKWSPEIIAVKGLEQFKEFVSLETIYKWIWEMKGSKKRENRPYKYLFKELRHGRRRQKRGNVHQNRGCIPNRNSIEERPKIVEDRKRLGDLEVDLVMGKNHQPGLLIITDRATLKTSISKIKTKGAKYISKRIIKKLIPWKKWLKTLTYDNDLSFTNHVCVNKELGTQSYFTRPYSAQDKGTIENRIGVIRRFFPKKTDFNKVTYAEVQKVEKYINSRPVRKFDYLSPDEYFSKKLEVAFIT